MEAIKGKDKVVAVLGRWNPGDLAYITSLHYEVRAGGAPDESATCLVIESQWQRKDRTPWPATDSGFCSVRFELRGISRFKFEGSGGPIQIMGFDIIDIADRGWEQIRYLVEDYEDGKLSVFCSEVRVVHAKPSSR